MAGMHHPFRVTTTRLLFLAISFQALYLTGADCPPINLTDEMVTTYTIINETQYDRNYSKMNSGQHPLGFYSGTLYYNQNKANPCIKITAHDARSSKLEIKFETDPPARLCFKDQASSGRCFDNRGTACQTTPGDIIYIEFYCDGQCAEADVNFWYRLVLSPPAEDLDNWCNNRPDHYPLDLLTVGAGMTFPVYTTPRPKDGTGTAAGREPWPFCIAAILMLGWLV